MENQIEKSNAELEIVAQTLSIEELEDRFETTVAATTSNRCCSGGAAA
jgi:hypothetical protein